jgi:ubiquinone biosynthesis protein
MIRRNRGLRFRLRTSGVEAAVRLGLCLVTIAASRALCAVLDLFSPAARAAARRRVWQQRSALRLVRVLGRLRGAFAKAGQFASLRHDVLPAAVCTTLSQLQSRVPPMPFPRIRAAVEAELGAPLEAHFSQFEPEPVGAASVAQVHRARLEGGRQVAVKVQYPWIEAALPADLALLRAATALLAWWTGHQILDPEGIAGEFAAGLSEELDFEREGRVAREIAGNLAHDPQTVVPEIITSHTTRRVLTMSYYEAVPVNDRGALAELGVKPAAVLEVLAHAYAKQVFVDGLFHADPHPGNLFVLDEPTAAERPRVLFVDFGLSKRLDPSLRQAMREGIYALLQRDLTGFVERMDRMGMIAPGAGDGVRAAVAEMFEQMRAGADTPLPGGTGILALKDRAKALLQETPGLQLPNDLLLYAKTLSYLFSLGAELDPETDLMKISLPYLMRFLSTG